MDIETEKAQLKAQHADEFDIDFDTNEQDFGGDYDAYNNALEKEYQAKVRLGIKAEIQSHGLLTTSDEILEEVQRLRECRRKFSRKYEHTLYTRYSNRLGELRLQLNALGVDFPKPVRKTKARVQLPKKSLYEIYRGLLLTNQITLEQFVHYTRQDGGVREPAGDNFVNECRLQLNPPEPEPPKMTYAQFRTQNKGLGKTKLAKAWKDYKSGKVAN